jgi:hypothetical protein
MKVTPPGEGPAAPTGELGLDLGEQERFGFAGADHMRGDRYFGLRHGRQVEVRVQAAARGLRATPIQATWVRAAVPAFTATADDGHFAVSGDAGGAAGDIIMSLAVSPAWDHLVLRGGPDGLAAQRRTTMRGQNAGWLYDLWLAERLAAALGARPLPPLAHPGQAALPYGLG